MAQAVMGTAWRAMAFPVRPTGTLPRCLTLTQRALHCRAPARTGTKLPQTHSCRLGLGQCVVRTGAAVPAESMQSWPFLVCRRQNRRSFGSVGLQSGLLTGRTLLESRQGSATRTGLGRAPHACSWGMMLLGRRWISQGQRQAWKHRNKSVMLYGVALVVLVSGLSYAAVPLYAVFCQATGLGGQATKGHNVDLVGDMEPVRGRTLSIRFNADTAASMRWSFRPQQLEIKLVPGETALAFYSAVNPTDKPITGISTYNVVPFDAGQYFNKIQCFCFEEQRLNPHEQVDMPVFFYIDPEFAEDPKMAKVDTITLSYTFFEAKEGLVLPDPYTRPALAVA